MLGTMKMKPANLVLALSLGIAAAAASAQDAKPGDAAAGQKKADMCIGCHGIPGYQASFPEVYKVGVALSGTHDARYFNPGFV